MNNNCNIICLIVAAGTGVRAGLSLPKQYYKIDGETILKKAIKNLSKCSKIDKLQIVISEGQEDLYNESIKNLDNLLPVAYGGKTRQESVLKGLQAIEKYNHDYVLIHDAARPFVSSEILENLILEVKVHQAVIPAIKVSDTVKQIDDNNFINETLDRNKIYLAQTPQVFNYKLIFDLHKKFQNLELTDDAALFEKAGLKVKIIEGDNGNYKITTAEDIEKLNRQKFMQVRVGNGFDVHEFEDGDFVIFCGIKIPYSKKLKGHSDADVAWHALTDAILGAIAMGDIGEHFSDKNPEWKNANSEIFLKHAADLMKEKNGTINNIDITIIAEEPKLQKYKELMVENTARVLEVDKNQVNVKATTTEKLGFLGRKEGVAAFATVSISIL